MLDEVQLPLVPVKDTIVGYVDVLDHMHFEMELSIHSWPSSFDNIIDCGADNGDRYPSLYIHRDAGKEGDAQQGLYVAVKDDGLNVARYFGAALELNRTYVVEVEFTQSWLTLVVDGETVWEGAKKAHLTSHTVPCYCSNPWNDAADVTITALSMESVNTMFPTPSPSMLIRFVHFGIVIFLHSVFPDPLHSLSVFPAESLWKCLEMTASAPLRTCFELTASAPLCSMAPNVD